MNNHNFATSDFPARILGWYDRHARILPWRKPAGETADAYHVWLSEIMLQQTTVATVGPYYRKFLQNWPTVQHLASAPLDDVLSAWAGLGYYARARNLHKCANAVCEKFGGDFPSTEVELLTLPGVGAYTAAAVAAIAFQQPAVVLDGNIERIVSRVFRFQGELPKGREALRELAGRLSPKDRPGDYAQALMDIGATVCTPKKPDCAECPVSIHCAAEAEGDAENYPRKAPKKVKPTRKAVIFWIEDQKGDVLMRRREESGLLGGMMEFPSTNWDDKPVANEELNDLMIRLGLPPGLARISGYPIVKHTFTHFHLQLSPVVIRLPDTIRVTSNEAKWTRPLDFNRIALPTLMKKVADTVLASQQLLPI